MTKSLIGAFIFLIGVGISISFQNCGGSSLEASSSNANDGLRVEVLDNENSEESANGENGTFGFNLNNGDNIFYITGGGLSLDLATSRILAKIYYSFLESHIYERRGTTFPRDLPSSYCANSALPHCAHTNNDPCVGLGCYKGPSPVRCHWQKRLSNLEENNMLQALNSLQFVNRQVSVEDPMISDCNNPLLKFYKEKSSLEMSLADPACVPDGEYYASNGSGAQIETLFENELSAVADLTNNQGDSEFCNNYSAYAWDTSKFSYRAYSGFVQPEDSYRYEVDFEARSLMIDGEMKLAGMVDMVFKESGNDQVMCANRVPVQPAEINVVFPEDGFTYEVFRSQAAVADVATAEITFEDPSDGGMVWQFFLDRASALSNSGGAIINSTQSDAIKALIQNVLVNRAKTSGIAQPCPPSI